jgi:hypothetical protein
LSFCAIAITAWPVTGPFVPGVHAFGRPMIGKRNSPTHQITNSPNPWSYCDDVRDGNDGISLLPNRGSIASRIAGRHSVAAMTMADVFTSASITRS